MQIFIAGCVSEGHLNVLHDGPVSEGQRFNLVVELGDSYGVGSINSPTGFSADHQLGIQNTALFGTRPFFVVLYLYFTLFVCPLDGKEGREHEEK